jgi:hypothetical protein
VSGWNAFMRDVSVVVSDVFVYVDEPSSVRICEIDPCQRFLIISVCDVPPSPQKPSGRRTKTSETVGLPLSVASGSHVGVGGLDARLSSQHEIGVAALARSDEDGSHAFPADHVVEQVRALEEEVVVGMGDDLHRTPRGQDSPDG